MNTIKIALLSLIIIVAISYFTASKPIQKADKLPELLTQIDQKQLSSKNVFSANTIIMIANHDALTPLQEVANILTQTQPKNKIVMVANTSSMPWMIKEFVITTKLKEMFAKEQNTTLIMDNNGVVSLYFGHTQLHKTYYSLYFIDANHKISKIADGNVSDGDFDRKFSTTQIQTQFATLIAKLQHIQ